MAQRILMLLLPLLNVLSADIPRELFQTYLLGLMQESRYFSVLGLSGKTSETLLRLYINLRQTINWEKILYSFAKTILDSSDWYLIVDGTPLVQEYARHRIAKHDHVNIEGQKNVPQNQIISLILTNGSVQLVLDYRIWVSPKVSRQKDYRKQTDLALDLVKRCQLMQIPVRKIIFDNFFASRDIIMWLNKNEYEWTTRLRCNRIIYQQGKASRLEDFKLNVGDTLVGELKGIPGNVKIVCMTYQDETVYAATNAVALMNTEIQTVYRLRWKIEEFHRDAKQNLGLEYLWMRNWRSLKKSCGLCLPGLQHSVGHSG